LNARSPRAPTNQVNSNSFKYSFLTSSANKSVDS